METNPYHQENIPYTPQYPHPEPLPEQQEYPPYTSPSPYQEATSEYYEENTFASEEWVPEYREEQVSSPEPFAQYQKIQPLPVIPESPFSGFLQGLRQHLVIVSLLGFAAFGGFMAATQALNSQPTGPSQIFPATQQQDDHHFYYLQDGEHHCQHHHHHEEDSDMQNPDSY